MSHNYKVTLTPQEAYFFGGEHTFSGDDLRDESSRYSASSTHFPQQTAVLGMLRKTMLIQNKNLTMHLKGEWIDSKAGRRGSDKNYFDALRLTGKDSFSYDKEADFGTIEKISPLFITRKNRSYIINAKDSAYTPKFLDSKMSLKNSVQQVFVLDGFNAKEHKEDNFIASDKSLLNYADIFQEVHSVGIKKAQSSQENEDGFFQKSSFMLKENASFTFYLELSESISWSEAYVTLGADQSPFKLHIEETDESFKTLFKDVFEEKAVGRVVLNSETILSEEAYTEAIFVLGKRATYRQLKNKNGDKSKRYYLLQRGSIIYTDEIEKLTATLSQPHLQKVGINNFTTIKGL